MTKSGGVLGDGTRVKMKSGSEGWIRGEIIEYYDVIPVVGGMMYGGGMTPGYKVRVLDGKHKGQVLNMPLNYVERDTSWPAPLGHTGSKPGTMPAHSKPIPSWRRF